MVLSLYLDESDRARHQMTIHSLAESLQLPEQTVAHIYESELAKLCDHATVREYLSMLTVKHVKSMLGRRASTN